MTPQNSDGGYSPLLARLAGKWLDSIERLTLLRRWSLWAGAIAVLLCLLVRGSSGTLHLLAQRVDGQCLAWQVEHPFTPVDHFLKPLDTYANSDDSGDLGRASHLYKIGYRLTVPLLSRVTSLGLWGWIVLPVISGLLFYPLLCSVAAGLTGDRVLATLFTWTYAVSEAGHLFFGDYWLLCGDGVAFALLLFAIACRNPWAVGLFSFLAAFTDERGLLANGFVFFLLSCKNGQLASWRLSRLWTLTAPMWAVVAASAAYLAVRFSMQASLGITIDDSGLFSKKILLQHLQEHVPHAFFLAFKGLWLIPVLAIVAAGSRRNWSWFICFVIGLSLLLLSSVCVSDLFRSLAYGFPLLLAGIWAVTGERRSINRQVFLGMFCVSLLWCDIYRSGYNWLRLRF